MISQAGWWTQTPSATPLQPIKWNASFWIMFTSDDWPGWLRDSNPICHLFPAKKMKCSLLDYVHFGWSARLVNGLKPHPPPLSSQKKWNAHFWIMFNFWWSAGLVDGLKPHLPPLSYQKNEILIFGLCPTSHVGQTGQWTQTPSTTPLQPIKWNASFLDYAQLLMIGQAGRWTQTPSTARLQPKKWNPRFCITLNFWWSAGLVNGLEPHLLPLSSQKNEILAFVLRSTSDDQPGLSMDLNPIHHLSPAKKWNAHILILLNFWWLAGLFNGLEPHPPPLSTQKNEMLIFGLCSTSDDQPGWSMDSNHICHPSPNKKNEMLIFGLCPTSDVGQTGQWTQTPSTTPLQPK